MKRYKGIASKRVMIMMMMMMMMVEDNSRLDIQKRRRD